jgi:hypothetical protein
MAERDDLIAACRALGLLLKTEYPEGYSLAEIVSLWGVSEPFTDKPITMADVEAIGRIEHLLAPANGNGKH